MSSLFVRLRQPPFEGGGPADTFLHAATTFLAELNAIHAFREGNGRAQLAFMRLVSLRAGHPLNLSRIEPSAFLNAMVKSFHGVHGPLARELRRLL